MGIENSTVLIYERGDHTYLGEVMAKKAKKVMLYTPILGPHPFTRDDMIGSGIDGVEKIDDFEAYKNKADLIMFPGVYDGEKCDALRKEGFCTYGAGLSEEIELDRELFLDTLGEMGLKRIFTYRADGFDDAERYLMGKHPKYPGVKTDKWIKTPYCRGDFDTVHFYDMDVFAPWFTYHRHRLGTKGSAEIKLLIQDAFPCDVESGGDFYNLDGAIAPNCLVGYEDKDKLYIFKVFKEAPAVLREINDAMAPIFKKYGYRGQYSTEARMKKPRVIRYTDCTSRAGSPPGESFCEQYEDYPGDVWKIANGILPDPKPLATHGCQIQLVSWWNEDKEICVKFPKEYKDNVKLHNYYKHENKHYCVPNDTDGYFGAVTARGNSAKDAYEKCKAVYEEVHCLGMERDQSTWPELEETIKKGKQFGIVI